MKIKHLTWDSNFFGYRIAKISNIDPDTKPGILKDNIKTASKKGYQCLYLAIPPNAKTLISYCDSNDFNLVGLKTTLIKKNLSPYKFKKQIKDEKNIQLLPGLLNIARQKSEKRFTTLD